MSRAKIVRAWEDPEYRQSLSDEERSLLPANPAGLIELHNEDLSGVAGGAKPMTAGLCTRGIGNCTATYQQCLGE